MVAATSRVTPVGPVISGAAGDRTIDSSLRSPSPLETSGLCCREETSDEPERSRVKVYLKYFKYKFKLQGIRGAQGKSKAHLRAGWGLLKGQWFLRVLGTNSTQGFGSLWYYRWVSKSHSQPLPLLDSEIIGGSRGALDRTVP